MKNLIYEKIYNVDEKSVMKRATFWNMMASLISALTNAVILFFVSRFCGVAQAGIFSIAAAIAYQCMTLGNFGVRSFHASDVKREFSFDDFFYFRIFSVSLMIGMLLYYSFFSGYTSEKIIAVFLFGIFKGVDVVEDLFHGEYHRNGRLDIGAILLTLRSSITIFVYAISLVITKQFIISTVVATVFTILFFLISNRPFIKKFCGDKLTFHIDKFKLLLMILVPIALTNYLKLYITNSPKYAIDAVLTDADQALFNVLFMPVFTISLLSDIVFRPYIPKFSSLWKSGNLKEFKKMAIRQFLVIVGLTVVIITGGVVLGLTLLELIYAVQLHDYMFSFVLLLLGGGFTTLVSFEILIMTIQREEKKMAIINILVFVLCLVISNPLVKQFGITGASALYLILNVIPSILFFGIVLRKYKIRKNEVKCL